MKISMNDIKNGAVHFFIGVVISWLYFLFTGNFLLPMIAVLSVAVTIEICQYMYNDDHQLLIKDRLIDVALYLAGSATILLSELIH